MADDSYVLVVAIDFGTTFSGYAFSFKTKPNAIKMNKSWGASLGFQSYKTPTTVLVDPSGKLKAFGFEAEEEYANLEEDEVTPDMYALYQRFKMMLHEQKKGGDKLLVHSTNGNIRPAVDVFAMALEYLKDHVIAAISLHLARHPDAEYIRWVLTVPAIWSDAAKQFMRKAAVKAKLIDEVNSKQLLIALEPEAASLYCRTLEMKHFIGMQAQEGNLNLAVNTKYMVIDAGGGTIDITVHETEQDGRVKELYNANGGPWGGSYVDGMYENMLTDIFGLAFIKEYKSKNPNQWLIMIIDFEKRKRASKPDSTASTNIPLNMGFARQFEKFTGKELESAFKESSVPGVKFSSSGMLCISATKMAGLFENVISNIEEHVREQLQHQVLGDISHIFLVGGFAECAFLQKMIGDNFGTGKTILIPEEASMCVLKGAVMYGHTPSAISARISRYTYAVGTSRKLIPGKDDENFKRKSKGTLEERIDYLQILIQAGDSIVPGTFRSTRRHPHNPEQTQIGFSLYRSSDILPQREVHPTDAKVTKLAKITVQSPDTSKGKDRHIEVTITFGGTEILFNAIELGTENEASTVVAFEV